MKKFRYRLQKVLQVREKLKSEAQRELLARNAELSAETTQKEALLQAYLANRIQEGAVITHGELITSSGYAARLQDEMAHADLRIQKATEAVAEATAKFIEASKNEKVLSTHKEKKVAEYREEVFKEDERFLDELATQRAARKRHAKEKENDHGKE